MSSTLGIRRSRLAGPGYCRVAGGCPKIAAELVTFSPALGPAFGSNPRSLTGGSTRPNSLDLPWRFDVRGAPPIVKLSPEKANPGCSVARISGWGSLDDQIAAVRRGALG